MKNIILTLVFVLIYLGSYSQSQFSTPTVSINGQIYICDNSLGQYIRIVNQKNQVSDGKNQIIYQEGCIYPSFQNGEFQLIVNTFNNSFTNTRRMTLAQSDNYCIINFYFNLDGTVKEVWFRLKKNTQITPAELVTLEQNLKKLKFNLANKDCQGKVPFHIMNRVFYFKYSTLHVGDK